MGGVAGTWESRVRVQSDLKKPECIQIREEGGCKPSRLQRRNQNAHLPSQDCQRVMHRKQPRIFSGPQIKHESSVRGDCKRVGSCFGLLWRSVTHKTGRWLTHAWCCGDLVGVIKSSCGCPAPRRMQACWKVSRRKQQEKIKEREKRLKELILFSVTKRKLLCNPAGFQRVIVVIKVLDSRGSLIYWFANLPGWLRLDIEKTSCYHHETVARPPREGMKPPSLGVVVDKTAGAEPSSVAGHCFWFVGP